MRGASKREKRIRLMRLHGRFARRYPSGIRLQSVCDPSAQRKTRNRIRLMRLHGGFERVYPFGIRLLSVWDAFGQRRQKGAGAARNVRGGVDKRGVRIDLHGAR